MNPSLTEPLLNQDKNRYVIFPIQHEPFWEMYKKAPPSSDDHFLREILSTGLTATIFVNAFFFLCCCFSFFVLRSSFSVLRSPFFVLRSSFASGDNFVTFFPWCLPRIRLCTENKKEVAK